MVGIVTKGWVLEPSNTKISPQLLEYGLCIQLKLSVEQQMQAMGIRGDWWVPDPNGGCWTPVVGIKAEWWESKQSGGHQSRVVSIKAEW